ncbi:MAG TPA: Fic family protein [Candidatus Krumholzibacteria bacterium]|nr:Fic family protein [Candidatus Krumholzibacteria bacterium]
MPIVSPDLLYDFVLDSNRIEGIRREPTSAELDAHEMFLDLKAITIADLAHFVRTVVQGEPELRQWQGMDVTVGTYRPPPGGPEIVRHLEGLLADCNAGLYMPYGAHCAYESIHPFMDGNGRSGRALWLWMMKGDLSLPFLHRFYYQALDAHQRMRR